MNMKRCTIYLFLTTLSFLSTWGQGLIHVQHYSTEDGLSQNGIQAIVQDEDGYIWLATRNGLDMFNGYTFKNYKSYPTDEVKLNHNRMIALEKGGKHHLWCQTYDRQVYLFDTREKKFKDIFALHPKIPRCNYSRQILTLPNESTWIVGIDGELWRCDEKNMDAKEGLIHFCPNSNPYHGERILQIILDGFGNEWIFTDKGYFVYGKKQLQGKLHLRSSVHLDKGFYLLSSDYRLYRFTPEQGIVPLPIPHEAINPQHINKLKNGKLVLVTNQKAYSYQPENQEWNILFNFPNTKELVFPHFFYQEQSGNIWILCASGKLILYDNTTGQTEFITYPKRDKIENKCFIHEDRYGQIWFLPPNGYLSYYNPTAKRMEQAYIYQNGEKKLYDYSYYNIGVMSYLFDTQQNLWQCCERGVNKVTFSNNSHQYIPTEENSEVRGLFMDSRQHLWVGNKNGNVEVYDKNRMYLGNLNKLGQIVPDKSIKMDNSRIYCFFEDRQKRIWFGSREHGIYVAEPNGKKYKLYNFKQNPQDKESLNCNAIYSIGQDSIGRIWIGTYGGGLNLVEGNFPNLRFINKDNRLKQLNNVGKHLSVRHVYCTREGIMMAGSTDGLIIFSQDFDKPEDIVFHFNHSEPALTHSLASNDVLYIHETHSGKIYVVTYSGGISRITSDNLLQEHLTFEHLNKTNGLPSDIAYAIAEEGENLWISFETCLCRYNPQKEEFELFKQLYRDLHLLNSEASVIISPQKDLFLGTTSGLLTIDLKRLEKSDFIPPIMFTQATIRKDNKEQNIQPENNTLTLHKEERNVTITFSALDYTNVENLQYAYRLRGVSDEWVYIDNNHNASFVNLPAGKLILEVKSTNGDGVWINNITQLHINVIPTFWETGWAWIIYVLIILIGIVIVAGILAYIFDLKRKVDFEQQLTNLKLRFFTDISHELRTPLTLITAPIEEVLEKEQLSKKGVESMQIAKQNIDRMLRLINQLLDFKKIQNNKMKLYIEETDVIALFKRIFNHFSGLAEQRNIKFRFTTNAESKFIHTDVDKLEKILFNLLSNAFKYTPNGKTIELTVDTQGERLQFTVKDEGQGFDINQIDVLFSRFETLNKMQRQDSTGIGLSLVNELVQLIHGTIRVESSLGQGSCFHVSIPTYYSAFSNDANVELILNDSHLPATVPTTPFIELKEESDKQLTVLIVEDNEELRRFIVMILQEEYRMIEANNGVEGLEQIKKYLPDLVISDIMMPKMDGIELLDATRKDHDISHIPFILLSAKSTLEDRINGLEYGADDYITKPFSGSYLKARITSLLKQRTALHDYFMQHILPIENSMPVSEPPIKSDSQPLPTLTQFDEEFIRQLADKVEEHLIDADFRIGDLAGEMALSQPVLQRKIRALLGISPKDFVRDIRIKKAMHLMNDGEQNIANIAFKTGFSSPQYFARVFKEVKGCTPSEYIDSL